MTCLINSNERHTFISRTYLYILLNIYIVRYSPKFYKDLVGEGTATNYIYNEKFIRFGHYNGFAIGAVCARLEPDEVNEGKFKLYIMTINVLAAYRRRGVASTLLKHILEEASKDETITEVFLHVQTSNEEAKQFYVSHGFDEVSIVENYYVRVEPASAFLLRKVLAKLE